MEIYHLSHPHQLIQKEIPPSAMALGFFDGIHLGHQKVIKTAKEIAAEKGLQSAVMTFFPHPAVVLGHQENPEYLTPLAHKEQLIQNLDIDLLYVVQFDELIFQLGPKDFVDQYIVGLSVEHAVAGFDYTYGSKAKGTMATMPPHADGRFEVTVVDKLEHNGEKVSSTAIRGLIREGRVEDVPSLLGRYYETRGTVVTGEERGRTIGFPTANIEEGGAYLIPEIGVYAVKMKVKGEWHDGVASIGFKPTFHDNPGDKPEVEVHLFHFNKDIYGESVSVTWHKRLRGEVKFDSADALVEQMEHDKEDAKEYFLGR